MDEGAPKRSSFARVIGEDAKGGAGIPVNSCTMARKFEVSVVKTVVGARREALNLFLGFRTDADVAYCVAAASVVTVGSVTGVKGLTMRGSLFASGLRELGQGELFGSVKKSDSGSNNGGGWGRREERKLGAAGREEYASSPPLKD